uniref:Integrin, alpha 6a n=1 Tax=Oryzias latipes TaxID=8090 RepID=A0A3P9MP91_ORYLA
MLLQAQAALLLLHVLEPVLAFNLDPQNTLRKDGDPGTLFGLSLTFHQQLRPDHKVLLLIGAPKAKALGSQKSKVTGGLYKCEISMSNTCERVEFDNEEDPKRESKEDQWMGVTVQSQGPGGKIVTCAHRYERRTTVGHTNELHSIIGRCYVLSQDLTVDPNADEDGGNWNFCDGRDRSHEKFGYCQQGIAAAFVSHYLVFGAPGTFNWRGVVRMEHRNNTLIDMEIYDDGPYEVGDASLLDATLVPVPANSFLGFSVDSGRHILPGGVVTVVAGAPRANHSGAVVLLRKEDKGSLVGVHTFKGPRLASSFGYDVAVVDLNNDGWEDIVVGAPHFFMKEGDIGGAVYVYMNKEGRWERVTPLRLNGTKQSMFGLAVENIGDINLDSYKDIAVGAPLDDEGAGKVYIYLGSAHQIKTTPAQVLTGRANNIRFFGYSLAGKMDIDENFYPDLAVGSLADAVVIYRARPVIAINIEVKTSVREIDLKNKTCGNNICFVVKASFSYKTKPATYNSFLCKHKILRLFVSRDHCCVLFVQENIKDKVRPIFIEVSADIIPAMEKTTKNGLPTLAPILDPFKPNTSIVFVKEGCQDSYICYSNLKMNCSFENNVAEFVLSYERKDLALLVNVTNSGGDYAYETKLAGSFPRGLEYSGVRMVKAAVSLLVGQNSSQVDCELGNPLKRDSVVSTSTPSYSLTPSLRCCCLKCILLNIPPLKVKSTLVFELPLSVSGEASPTQVSFGGVVTGESAMKTEEDVGSLINITVRVSLILENLPKSNTEHQPWPKLNKQGKYLLYLMNVSTNGQNGVRCSPETEINSLKLTHVSMDSGIHWGHLQCTLLGIDGTTIELRTRLWNSTFLEVKNTNVFLFDSISWPFCGVKRWQVTVAVSPESDVAQYVVQWWVILLAVLAGILILALMVFMLWKCGFFKRSQKDDSVPQYHAVRIRKESVEREDAKLKPDVTEKKQWMTSWMDSESYS